MTKEQFENRYNVRYGKLGDAITVIVVSKHEGYYLYTGIGKTKETVDKDMYNYMNVIGY